MPVDKFGRNCDRTTTVYTGIDMENLAKCFLSRDGGNIAIGIVDRNKYIIKTVRIRCQIKMLQPKLCRHKRIYY